MPKQITPNIEQFYEDKEIEQIIQNNAHLQQQFNEPDISKNQVCVVLPLVYRAPGYTSNQLDLDIFIKHSEVTELGQLELYRVKDFIRQRVDVAPVMETVRVITGVEVAMVLESIKKQIKFLQKPENKDLPIAPAQMINLVR